MLDGHQNLPHKNLRETLWNLQILRGRCSNECAVTLEAFVRVSPPRADSTADTAEQGLLWVAEEEDWCECAPTLAAGWFHERLCKLAFCARLITASACASPLHAVEWRMARVICLGIDSAGKTALLQHASAATAGELPRLPPTTPTTGFHVRCIDVPPDRRLEVWDLGGGRRPHSP